MNLYNGNILMIYIDGVNCKCIEFYFNINLLSKCFIKMIFFCVCKFVLIDLIFDYCN